MKLHIPVFKRYVPVTDKCAQQQSFIVGNLYSLYVWVFSAPYFDGISQVARSVCKEFDEGQRNGLIFLKKICIDGIYDFGIMNPV